MEKAIDEKSGRIVSAHEATRRHGYLCPSCRGAVSWKRGSSFQRPAFVHRGKEINPSCELYYPWSGQVTVQRPVLGQSQLGLYLSVRDITERVLDWDLKLSIPSCPVSEGKIVVEHALQGTLEIPARNLQVRRTLVRVRLDAETFRIRTDTIPDEEYRRAVKEPLPGLDWDVCNVFQYSEVAGRRLHPKQPLITGRTYFCICSNRMRASPPPSDLLLSNLHKKGDWCGYLIKIPATPSSDASAWIGKFIKRKIEPKVAGLSIISPAHREQVEEDFFVIESGMSLIVGIHGDADTPLPTGIAVGLPGQATARIYELSGSFPYLFSILGLPKGITQIFIPNCPDDPLLVGVEQDLSWHEPAIPLVTVPTSRGFESAPTYTAKAQKLLDQYHASAISEPVEFQLPVGLTPRLWVQKNGSTTFKEVEIQKPAAEQGPQTFEDNLAEVFRLFCRNEEYTWRLEMGPFGTLCSPSSAEKHASYVLLPQKTFLRIRWLCTWIISLPAVDRVRSSALPVDLLNTIAALQSMPLHPTHARLLKTLGERKIPNVLNAHIESLNVELVKVANKLQRKRARSFTGVHTCE